MNNKLTGDGTWFFDVKIEGDDLVVENVRATCFGGVSDPQDDGRTASGISTRSSRVLGCALPRNYTGPGRVARSALGGSPIPAGIPFSIMVEVSPADSHLFAPFEVPFIDVGPAKKTKNGIDLTIAAAKKIHTHASATDFEARVNYRIKGGAKYASQT